MTTETVAFPILFPHIENLDENISKKLTALFDEVAPFLPLLVTCVLHMPPGDTFRLSGTEHAFYLLTRGVGEEIVHVRGVNGSKNDPGAIKEAICMGLGVPYKTITQKELTFKLRSDEGPERHPC